MRRVIGSALAGAFCLGSVVLVGAGSAGAQDTTTTTAPTTTTTAAPYVSGNKFMAVNVDTVVGSGSPTGSVTSGGCGLENVFGQGATVVFRMWGIANATGMPLVASNVKSVVIQDLPGVTTPPAMAYAPRDGYWTYGWKTSSATPIGVVPFKVVVTLNPIGAVYKTVRVAYRAKVNGVTKVLRKTVKVLVSATVPAATYTFTQTGLAATSQLTIQQSV